jgi:hypothetical protein
MKRQNKVLKSRLVELETAQRTKTKATTATLKSKSNNLKEQRQESSREGDVIATTAAEDWDHCAVGREYLSHDDMGHILHEVQPRKCPKWNDIAELSLIDKSYWAQ